VVDVCGDSILGLAGGSCGESISIK